MIVSWQHTFRDVEYVFIRENRNIVRRIVIYWAGKGNLPKLTDGGVTSVHPNLGIPRPVNRRKTIAFKEYPFGSKMLLEG